MRRRLVFPLALGLLAAFPVLAQRGEERGQNRPRSVYAGALGAALWAAFRHRLLGEIIRAPSPNPNVMTLAA